MISFNLNYLLGGPSPNTVRWGLGLQHRFEGSITSSTKTGHQIHLQTHKPGRQPPPASVLEWIRGPLALAATDAPGTVAEWEGFSGVPCVFPPA